MEDPGDKRPFGSDFEAVGTNVDPPLALRDHPGLEEGAERSLDSGVDVVLVPWAGGQPAPSSAKAPWHFVQLWTDKRIYAFDMALVCVAVIDRETGQRLEDPQVVGSRLTGGQLNDGLNVKMVYPLPVPGTQAVLEAGGAAGRQQVFVRTPPLARVLVRLVTVGGGIREKRPTWEAVSQWQGEERTDRQGSK